MAKNKNNFEIVDEGGATFIYLNNKELHGIVEYSVGRETGQPTTVTLTFMADSVAVGTILGGSNGK